MRGDEVIIQKISRSNSERERVTADPFIVVQNKPIFKEKNSGESETAATDVS